VDIDKMLTIWDTDEPQSKPTLLSTTGRVLCMMMADPKVTQITMSILFNVSETAIEKAVANLVNAGIVESVKNGRKNEYSIKWEVLSSHNDFQMMREIFLNDVQERFTDT
jgi:predicted transcriptional regulator